MIACGRVQTNHIVFYLTAINECALAVAREGATPCQNGGTCVDGVGTYYCHCTEGYTGTNCTDDGEPIHKFCCDL